MTKNKENFIKEHCKWYSECINCEMCSKVDEVNPNKCYEEYKKIKYFDNVDCEIILDIIRDALLEYNFGSDSPRLGYRDGYLIYCSTNYDWYRIECDYKPDSILMSALCMILEDSFGLDWNKF